jgi:hypothetical protein
LQEKGKKETQWKETGVKDKSKERERGRKRIAKEDKKEGKWREGN